MLVNEDFYDFLNLLEKYKVHYLIVGGYAFSFYAFPRYTKDLDIFIDNKSNNIKKINQALAEFGSPYFLDLADKDIILQLGIEPNRIDVILKINNVRFDTAWKKRIRSRYGDIQVNWIDIDSLIRSKTNTGKARHDEDVKILKQVRMKYKEKLGSTIRK